MMVRYPFKQFKKCLLSIGLFGIFLGACAVTPFQKEQRKTLARTNASQSLVAELSTSDVADGSVLGITLRLQPTVEVSSLQVFFESTALPVFPLLKSGGGIYQALLGIAHAHKPGEAMLEVSWSERGVIQKLNLPFTIIEGQYATEVLKVDSRHVRLSERDLKRAKREGAEVGEIYKRVRMEKFWEGPFLFPIPSEMTSVYGTKRVFNGELQSYHAGLDFRAAVGTPVASPAAGIVVLAKDLFFSGQTVILDHGYGVFTVYAHLNRIDVKVGKHVTPGAVLGLSGRTGRASGPHLHWGAVIHRVKVNPMDLTRLE